MTKKLGVPEPDADVLNGEPKVLLIGHGWVGQYCNEYFKSADIYTKKGFGKKEFNHYDLAIIAVPTPMKRGDGRCNTEIVEQGVVNHRGYVDHFLIKSTVEIGTTDRLKETYGVSVAMSPEYIGETLGHPLLEPRRDMFMILGGEDKTVEAISGLWKTVLHANARFHIVTAKEAEYIKYKENEYLMRLVDYWNDTELGCEYLDLNYDRVREGLLLDPRFTRSHSFVYPNNRGWSGKCLPKDMNALAYYMRKQGHPFVTLEHLIDKNANYWRKDYKNKERLRPEHPLWEENGKKS